MIGIVTDASRDRVTIRPLHNIELPQRAEQWSDDNYSVRWAGSGFGIFRNLDGVHVGGGYQTLGAAISEVQKLYPRQAGMA